MPSVSDIRLVVTFRDHPKRVKLTRRVGAEGALALVDLWLWAGENRPGGDLSGMTDEDVEIAANWRGVPRALVVALRDLHLIDGAEGAAQLHGWDEHQGWASGAARRSEQARANAISRWSREHHNAPARETHAPASELSAGAVQLSSGSNAPSPSPSPSPSPNPQTEQRASRARLRAVAASEPSPGLLDAYHAYPRKRGKTAGMRIAARDVLTPADLAQLRQAIANYIADISARNTDEEHTLYWSTFMGQWRDWIDATPTRPSNGNAPSKPVDLRRGQMPIPKGW